MSLRDVWQYEGGDPMIELFTHAVTRWNLDIKPGDRVLELGCRETDWAQRIKRVVPDCEIVGIDALPCPAYGGDRFVQGDASNWDTLPEPAAFDAVISLGAVEHFGLGYYRDGEHSDPIGSDKDIRAVQNAYRWLKPGGFVYFDVPWTPATYHQTNHYRVYDDATWMKRFSDYDFGYGEDWIWRARGWAPNTRERDDFTEVRPLHVHEPFWFYAAYGVKPT